MTDILYNRGSSVGIATGYGLDDRGSGIRGAVNFSLFHRVQTGSGAHPASYPMGTRVSFTRDDVHSPPYSVEVMNPWRYTSIPICLHGVVLIYEQGQLYLK
jgi:hypothetical protein